MKVIKGINKGDYLVMQTDKGDLHLGVLINKESRDAISPFSLPEIGRQYFLPEKIASKLSVTLIKLNLDSKLLPAFHLLCNHLLHRISNGKEKLQNVNLKEIIKFQDALKRMKRVKTKFPLDKLSLTVDNKKYTFTDQFILHSIWLPILMESNLPEIEEKNLDLFFPTHENVYHTMFKFSTQRLNLSETKSYSLINDLYSICGLPEYGTDKQIIDRWKKRIKRGQNAN